MHKLYKLTGHFIKEVDTRPPNFTGIVEYRGGEKIWYKNGFWHRENGPAVEHANGNKQWWFEGKRHRIDGPAFEYGPGIKQYWISDKRYTEAEHKLFVDLLKLKKLI